MGYDDFNFEFKEPEKPKRWAAWRYRFFLVLMVVGILGLGWLGLTISQIDAALPDDNGQLLPVEPVLPAPESPTATLNLNLTPLPTLSNLQGTLYYTARHGSNSHLWAFVPDEYLAVQISTGPFDDRDPAISPDQTQLAFSSNRDGFWDLYLMSLQTGAVRRLTQTNGYEGHPTWSPDGRWIAYEANYDGDFDIWIFPLDGSQAPIQLTNHPELDVSPAWDPGGRRIAFISKRTGDADIYMADLDLPDDRFTNLTQSPNREESFPSWGPQGRRLAYSIESDGVDLLMVQDLVSMEPSAVFGQGYRPLWLPDGKALVALLQTPYDSHIISTPLEDGGQTLPGLPYNEALESMAWSTAGLAGEFAAATRNFPTAEPLFVRSFDSLVSGSDRTRLVELPGVQAPNAQLSDAVDEVFLVLRARMEQELGWDFLGDLDNAFVGLNDPLPPGYAFNDWLYTGRAFAFSRAGLQAGWVEVIREDVANQTFWRVYVRTNLQDGSQGEPLRTYPWDFNARFLGDPVAYDIGGALKAEIPQGYYVDLTLLADDFGFHRVPAMANWRTYYHGARFNEFAMTENLDWEAAMLELYPSAAIITPTPYLTPTLTPTITPSPTPTPWWWRWRTPTPSATFAPPSTPTPTP